MDLKPWLKSYDPGLPHTLKPYPDKTILEFVHETVEQRPDHLALMFKGAHLSYRQLEQHVIAFAAALAGLGVQKGERVMLLLPNSPQAIIAQLGAWMAGAIVCPTNALYTEWELAHAVDEVEPETVVVLSPFYAKVKSLHPKAPFRRVIAVNIKDFLPAPLRLLFTLAKEKKEGYRIDLQPGDYWMSDLLRQYAGAARPAVTVSPSDPAILLFSGGTSGTPKAALGSHRSMLMSAMQLHYYARTEMRDWDDRLILAMPIFHVYGNMGLCTSLLARWPITIVPNPRDLNDLIAAIHRDRPNILHGVPTLFNSLLKHPKVLAGKADFSSIKVCYSAAAPLLAETKRKFEALTGARLLEAYGMTETMLSAVVCPTRRPYKPGSTGLPLPDVEVRIVDVETGLEELMLGESGEILIRSPQLMEGYWGHPDETAEIIQDGWLHTGDIGYMDEDGYLFLIDRKKDLIKPRGFQVWPREVEEVIATFPAVADVCVGGVPDAEAGEAVKAWIVAMPGQQINIKELRDHCRQKLTGYKIPKYIELRESLPKTMVGKTLRRLLISGEAVGG